MSASSSSASDAQKFHRLHRRVTKVTKKGHQPKNVKKKDTLTRREQILLAEYGEIQKLHVHYDTINMHWMSIITAGVSVLWGIIFRTEVVKSPTYVTFLELFIFAILCTWIQMMSIHRRIVVLKLSRSHEIEEELGMDQDSRFRYDRKKEWRVRRPGGHGSELMLYFVFTLFGVFISLYAQLSPFAPVYTDSITRYLSAWVNNISSSLNLIEWLRMIASILPILWAVYWIPRCRVDVAQFIRGFELPPRPISWLYRLGGYKGYQGPNPEICTLERWN